MDDGEQRIEDEWLLEQVRRQSRKVQIEALLAATLITVIFVLLPI